MTQTEFCRTSNLKLRTIGEVFLSYANPTKPNESNDNPATE